LLRHSRDLSERLALANEIAWSNLNVVDVVVVGEEAQPAGVMVDADVARLATRLNLHFDDASAVRGEHAVPGLRGEVDSLVEGMGEMDVAARWVLRIIGGDELSRAAGWRGCELSAPQRVEAAVLEARLERQLQRWAEEPGLMRDRLERHDPPHRLGSPSVTGSRGRWEHQVRR
jgi:hypothetical protein